MRRTALVFSVLWMVLVVVFYYWIHKPLTSYLATGLGGALFDTFTVIILTIVSAAVGRRLLTALTSDWQTLSRPERLAGEALLGLGAVSVILFGVGLVWLHVLSVTIILGLLAIVTLPHLIAWWREFSQWRHDDVSIQWQRGLMWFVGLNLLLAWVMAAAPPTIAFDSLTYHLVAPELARENNQFMAFEGSHFFGFPQLPNTLYAALLILTGGRLAVGSLLHFVVGGFLLMASGGYAARVFKSSWVGWLTAAFLLSATTLWLAMGWAYVDLFTAAYGMLALIALDTWRANDHKTAWLVVAGIFVGLGMSSKYNAAIVGVVMGVYILAYTAPQGLPTMMRQSAIFVGVASVVLLPWLLRNAFFYDNPLFPFGLETAGWDSLSSEWYTSADSAQLREFPALILPIFLTPTLWGVEGSPIFSATIGPLFLLLIPLWALTWNRTDDTTRQRLKGIFLLVILLHIIWIITSGISLYGSQTRFMFPMIGWVAALAAGALASLNRLPRKPLDFAWVMRMVVILVLCLTMIDHLAGTRPRTDGIFQGTTLKSHFVESRTLEYVLGVMDEQDYLEYRLGWHIVAMDRVNELPDGSTILFLWETRSLYCDEPRITCIEDSILHRWWHDRQILGDGSVTAILEGWLDRGVTHVLVWETGRDFEFSGNERLAPHIDAWDAMQPLLGEPLWHGEDIYTLYAIN